MRLTRDLLIEQFYNACANPPRQLVGAEFERHLLLPNGQPLSYFGHGGVGWLLDEYAERHGWEKTREGSNTIALKKGKARVTREPGAQLELSGSPFGMLTEVDNESRAFTKAVDELLEVSGATQVSLGYTPIASIPEIDWVPKGRYTVMQSPCRHR